MGKRKQKSLFPELDQVISVLHAGTTQDLVIIIVPSHDRDEEPLNDQEMWAMQQWTSVPTYSAAPQPFRPLEACTKRPTGEFFTTSRFW
jgi:hypothetical protein